MSNLIYRSGTAEFTIAASDKLAVFSKSSVKVYQRVNLTNHPNPWSLLQEVAANTEYLSAAFSAATEIRIEAGAAEVLYQAGVDALITERRGERGQPSPLALNATGALSAALMGSGIVTSTTAAAVAGTVPTGTVMDAAIELGIGESFDFSIINTGPNAFTVTGATGFTAVGAAIVAAGTSGTFRVRKLAAESFRVYRL